MLNNFLSGINIWKSVEKIWVRDHSLFFIRKSRFSNINVLENIFNRQLEVLGKIEVALISTRHGHYCSCSISRQYIITYPNGYFFIGNRVKGIGTCKHSACARYIAHTLAFAALCSLSNIGSNRIALCICSNFSYPFVLRSQSQKSNTKKGVSSSGKHFYFAIAVFYWKTNTCTHGFTNPVPLHFFEWFRPINIV